MARNRRVSRKNPNFVVEEAEVGLDEVAWIDELDRREIEFELKKWNLELGGTTSAMKNRFRTFVNNVQTGRRSRASTPDRNERPMARMLVTEPDMDETRKLLNQVRKWGIFYNGKSSQEAISFIEKLEDLKEEYEIEDAILLRALSELFKDKTSSWFRINKKSWSSWSEFLEEFKSFYFPENYLENLEEEILKRKQKIREKGKDYVLELQSMMRRHGGYSGERELNILYKNLDPSYKYYIRRKDVTCLKTFLNLIEEFEKLQMEDSKANPEGRKTVASYPLEEISGQSGGRPNTTSRGYVSRDGFYESHDSRRLARNRPVAGRSKVVEASPRQNRSGIRCFNCGQEGVTVRTCGCRQSNQGNTSGTGQNRGMVSSARNQPRRM